MRKRGARLTDRIGLAEIPPDPMLERVNRLSRRLAHVERALREMVATHICQGGRDGVGVCSVCEFDMMLRRAEGT